MPGLMLAQAKCLIRDVVKKIDCSQRERYILQGRVTDKHLSLRFLLLLVQGEKCSGMNSSYRVNGGLEFLEYL